MKTTKLSGLTIVPENYETQRCNQINWAQIHSEMTGAERRFINGLITYYQPGKILEIGVCAGGGTVNILNAIGAYGGEAQVISVDHAVSGSYGYDPEISYSGMRIGYEVQKHAAKLPLSRWRLMTGQDPAEVMEEIGGDVDFAVIDTAHYHPVESLNFLCVLPFLSDGAIVVIHDVMGVNNVVSSGFLAPRVLMSVLAADKLLLAEDSERVNFNSNIAAVQVSADTRKYIQNVFDALFIPWGKMPTETDLQNIRRLLARHYLARQLRVFDKAVMNNRDLCVAGKLNFTLAEARKYHLLNMLKSNGENPITFYGAGFLMQRFLDSVSVFEFSLQARVWDLNAENIGEIGGLKVTAPDFQTVVSGWIVIIMISDRDLARGVRAKLEPLGYTVFHGIKEYLLDGGQ
ncbi:MAG: class I SAM-dependent methyltransferase [Gracilibacteraceae bacterium]|jgi:predicted O-methyltransferase YrrM|nr:class I SAM-dependent methyltransferase [Gracilibacteraceae bacterium]